MVYTEARSVADAARRRRSSGSFRSYERRRPKQAQLYCYIKRPLDIVLASIALVLLGPVLIVVAGLVVACDGHGALFRQVRVGRGGRRFVCLKFRTMVPDADTLLRKVLDEDADAHRQWIANRKLKHDPRVTKVGRHLRRLSLDELPQLVNVVRGEMSIVGPRPAMESEMILYGSAVDACLRVRPGLTGPWQVGGRANLTFSERVNLESKYAADMSLLCDVRIMLKTIVVLINRDGAC